ncbi:tetratricopeptide repeat protein 28-like [Saccostrea echinata]|uniref:tetratricopeptide repeat protein 28-like n=1 Tax=Saccostrea echinata TaxID=191078 RepID=UPI002A81A7EE|nr:tetratricopeptide repeat protein 28-like [Saccostrea echinata]
MNRAEPRAPGPPRQSGGKHQSGEDTATKSSAQPFHRSHGIRGPPSPRSKGPSSPRSKGPPSPREPPSPITHRAPHHHAESPQMYTNHSTVSNPRQPALPSSDTQQSPCGPRGANQTLYLQKIRESSEAVNSGDFRRAIHLYSEAIRLDPSNHILFTNRSAAYCKLRQFQKSLEDAKQAKQLNPKWAKAYLREGVALQNLGQHGEALAAFGAGLAQDSNNSNLITGLIDAALKSPLKDKLGPTFNQLQKLKLNQSSFVIISVIGQELLAAGHYSAAVSMLEAALQIGTCSLKLRGSVFSALSSAYWGLGSIDTAISYMQHDLSVAKSLGDHDGECRAYGNLGSAYFSKGHYKEALSNHRYQLALAMKLKQRQAAASALGSLGHVYTAIGDYPNALQSHKQCLFLMKQSGDKLQEAREIGNAGAVYLAMGEFSSAVECHNKHLQIAKNLKNSVEEARAYSNLGSAFHYKRDYQKAISYHKQVLQIAEERQDKTLEARAYAGLGHASRCMMDYENARKYHEKQLDNALQTKDKVAEGRACSNLGIIFHQLSEFKSALKLHQVHLRIAKELGDNASQGRAYGNLGNAYCALKNYEQAVKYHKQELQISSQVNDRHSEGATHGNLAVAYQALGMVEKAQFHYTSHLNISKELKDTPSEARALCNLGNFYSSRGDYASAVRFYEQYLMLSQELHDSEGEAKACFNLGYAHFALGNHLEAVRYYEQDMSIARELKDQLGMARAYCNLGLAHKALHDYQESLECQRNCLTIMKSIKNTKGIFRALGNIGDVLLKMGDVTEAIAIYKEQLQMAKQTNSKDLIATSYGALGAAHRNLGQYDKALGYHTQELSIRQDMDDRRGECRAHGHLGNVHMSLGHYMDALKCYEEQLEKARELQNSSLEAQACGNLAITKMNMNCFEDAIGLFEQQLAMLEQVSCVASIYDKGRALGNLGDCYEALGDFDESVKCHEQYLAISQQANSLSDQDKAYRGLGNAHKNMGNLQQALVCFEKRLVVAHELNSSSAKASAYGELGCLHSHLGNFEQAISCLQHQLTIAQEMEDKRCEGEAACGLGGVYQNMGDYDKALEYHQMDLHIAEQTNNSTCQCRAYGNLGLTHESLGNFEEAIQYEEQHLSIAAQLNDRVAKTLAYSSLGRVHHALNNHSQAVEYLRQGLTIAEQLGRKEDEAKIRHRLGLSLWGKGDLDECQQQLYKATDLFESIRRDGQLNSEYKMSLFDLQTACYQALQRVLVSLNRHEEALVMAERACTRAFIDYLLERQAGSEGMYRNDIDPAPITCDQIVNIVSKQKSLVLCYSIAAGYLYSWLLTPDNGIVKFHETNMTELEADYGEHSDTLSMRSVNFGSCSVLDQYVGHVRESMGIESHTLRNNSSRESETDSESDDVWQQHLEELGDKLNAENDRTGFLRMVNRNHKLNSSNYSLSSMFSLSTTFTTNSFNMHRKSSLRMKSQASTRAPLSVLYQVLIGPMEEAIATVSAEWGGGPIDLVLVLQGELYLIPFPVLRKEQNQEYMFERFNLHIMPSITALTNGQKHDRHGRPVIDSSGAVIVGSPKMPSSVSQGWCFKDIPGSEYEARIVGELLTSRPLIGAEATKAAVLNQIEQVEVIHFACHLSWKLSSIVLCPGDNLTTQHSFPSIDSDDSASDMGGFDGPSLSEYLLTAADILNLKLHAKLVVLSSGYTDDRAGRINSDGVVGLTRALLSAGAKCVLYSLWPVPDAAAKLLMRNFYTALQEGRRVTQALSHGIKSVQSTKQFSHPANWGGWILVGHDVKLSSKIALMGHAICELLQSQNQCREAMRVLLHLIEKSLQRIHQGIKNSMYTTCQSIENKVGGIPGWKDLLQAVGFRFEAARNGLPPAVFFPQTDPGDRLTQASASLQALLGLPPSCLTALSKFLPNYEAGEAYILVIRDILSKMAAKESNIEVQICVKLWRMTGCHEFLASLGLDLVEVGKDEVTLRLGKQANRRQLQFALQSLVAVFDTQEAPKSLSVDSSSSLESLSSSHSGSTSTSNFSKGSTPPLSPRGSRKKSLFNPAEMEKMRMMTKMQLMHQGGLSGRKVSSRNQRTDPSIYLSHQSRIRNMYGPSGTTLSHHSHHNDIHELQEISENSESETDGHTSSGNSWKEYRMTVSTNSDSECSTIPDARTPDRDMLQSSTEHYSLSDGFGTQSPSSCTQEYTYSYPAKLSGSVRSGGSDYSEHEEYNFSRQNSGYSDVSMNSSVRDSEMSHRPSNFDRYDAHRSSDLSNISSACEVEPQNSLSDSGSDLFQRNDALRQSDMSDTSGISDTNGLPNELPEAMIIKNIKNVEPVPNESGFHSEVTSSNQSDASQQSIDVTKLGHKELALRINADVENYREKLEHIQRESLASSRQEAMALRKEFHNSQKIIAPAQQANGHPSDERSVVGRQMPLEGKRPPPPIPKKPKSFQPYTENLSSNSPQSANVNNTHPSPAQDFNNVNSIVSRINSLAVQQNLQSSNISAFTSSSPKQNFSSMKNNQTVDKTSLQNLARGSVTRDASSFLNSVNSQNHQRPDSKMSVSSSASSIVTVIHSPNNPVKIPPSNSRLTLSPSPMHNSQTSTPEIPESPISGGGNGHPLHDNSFNSSHGSTRGTSPKSILNSSPSCLREKNKKPKKRVSFSDSEPSDLDSSSTQNSNRASPVTPIHFPINPADRFKPNNFIGSKQPIRISGNHISETTNQYPPMKTFGNGSVPTAMESFYMNGTVRGGVVVNGNQNPSAMELRNSALPTYKANLAQSGVNPGGPGTRTSDQIRQLYLGRGRKTQVLQSSKC